MEQKQIDEIRMRCEAATAGEWFYEDRIGISTNINEEHYDIIDVSPCDDIIISDADARFIIHARQDIPALLDEVTTLKCNLSTVWDMYRNTELENADLKKRLENAVELPYAPGTIFQQDMSHEYDIIFTGNVLYETKCNEDTEYECIEDLTETVRIAADSLAREEAEKALRSNNNVQ